jgi:hypothetical protein
MVAALIEWLSRTGNIRRPVPNIVRSGGAKCKRGQSAPVAGPSQVPIAIAKATPVFPASRVNFQYEDIAIGEVLVE